MSETDATIEIRGEEVNAEDFLAAAEEAQNADGAFKNSEGESGNVRVEGDAFNDCDADVYVDGEHIGYPNIEREGLMDEAREAIEAADNSTIEIEDTEIPIQPLADVLDHLPDENIQRNWEVSGDVMVVGDGCLDDDVKVYYKDNYVTFTDATTLRERLKETEDGEKAYIKFTDNRGKSVIIDAEAEMQIERNDETYENDHTVFFNSESNISDTCGWVSSHNSGDAEPDDQFGTGYHYVESELIVE
jgi:hypothetical protein